MGFVYADNLQPGMTLASELRTSSRRLLLPAGAVLNPGLIQTLRMRGILRVNIEGMEDDLFHPRDSQVLQETLAAAEQYLSPFFALSRRHDPVVAEIFRLATLHTATRMSQGWQPPSPMPAAEVARILGQRETLLKPLPVTPAALVAEGELLISLPEVYTRIVEVLNCPTSSAARVADLVSKDSNLASRLLRIVNSPCYGFPSRVDSISRAITLIGANELTILALGVSLMRAFDDIPADLFDMESFWQHAIACGTFARMLATRIGGLSGEQLFIGGLLHDIGRLALLKQLPSPCLYTMVYARQETLPLFRAEREIFGFDHGRVGGMLSAQWRFSKALEMMIGYHHYPKSAHYDMMVSVLHVANMLAAAFSHGLCAEQLVPALDDEAWKLTGLYAEDLEELVIVALQQIDDTVTAFFGSPETGSPTP